VAETRRRSFEVRGDAAVPAVIQLDSASITRQGECLREIARVEVVSARAGDLRALAPFVEGLCQACGLTPASTSVFALGLQAADLEPQSYFDFGYAGLLPEASTGEYAYALLRRYFRDFLAHEPGTRLGEDPEELHDMRVATRKLRAVMGLFRDVLSPRFTTLREELRWFGQTLGDVRDLDVQSAWLTQERDAASWQQSVAYGPLIKQLAVARDVARAVLLTAMRSPRYDSLVDGMKHALIQADYATEQSAEPVRQFAARTLRKRFSRFEEAAEKLAPDSEAAEYHAVRILGKRLRYAIESLLPTFEENQRVARMVDATKRAQDVLGEYQDCVTATARLQAIVESAETALPSATVFLMGELAERRRARMSELREAWPATLETLKKSWQPVGRLLKKRSDLVEPAEEDEKDESGPPPAVQRPFWLLRPFVGRGQG
jgi:CHAD domain-containing protein